VRQAAFMLYACEVTQNPLLGEAGDEVLSDSSSIFEPNAIKQFMQETNKKLSVIVILNITKHQKTRQSPLKTCKTQKQNKPKKTRSNQTKPKTQPFKLNLPLQIATFLQRHFQIQTTKQINHQNSPLIWI
jgi:hypothetical protein